MLLVLILSTFFFISAKSRNFPEKKILSSFLTISLSFSPHPMQDLICSPADILEPRKQGTVRVSICVGELLRVGVGVSAGAAAGRAAVNSHQNGHMW